MKRTAYLKSILTKEVLENLEEHSFIYYQVQKEIFEMFWDKKQRDCKTIMEAYQRTYRCF